ncbi:MAG: phage holin family protein [Methanobrevibacter sp.]|nr:phage holin family protein [Methanobrevibacter sp.]
MNTWRFSEHINNGNLVYGLWAAGASFFASIGWWLFGCAFFVLADFITGCWAARKNGEMWTSNKFRNSISKCGAYMFVIICARIFESMLPAYLNITEVTKLFAAIIVGVEFYSVLENFYKATGSRVFYLLTQWTNKKLKNMVGEEKGE